ncbi:MAG TPA: MFS transporter [Candidatus Dormibacteraeota bacterium]|nr:MFS transporter [Candidatus Dormibacteraeota bacterium]
MAVLPISAPPTARLSFGRLAAINAFWFGGGAHWQPIYISLIPVGATLIAGANADLLIGRVTAAGGVFALLTPILVGWLSDRTVTRWGRRRPWMVAGTILNIVGLGLLALSASQLTFVAAYLVVQLSNNAAGAAYTGVIPDVVRAEDRGRASGLLGTMNQLGTVVGVGLVGLTFKLYGDTRAGLLAGYGVVAVILAITLLITIFAVKEPVPISLPRLRGRVRVGAAAIICGAAFLLALIALFAILLAPLGSLLWPVVAVFLASGIVTVLAARHLPALMAFFVAFRSNDFFWTFATRALVTLGIFSILPFMELYFRDVVRTKDAGAASAFWLLAVIAGAIIPSMVGGVLSDRTGRRKLFVYISSAMQAVVVSVLLFGLVRSLTLLYVLGILYGIGYGAYYAVDWALACDVLPNREEAAGRDMALWHVSFTLPQVLAPAILAGFLHFLNEPGHLLLGISSGHDLGFRFIFGSAALWFILGTIMVSRIRGVR